MRLFPQEIIIEGNEGFAPEKDIFRRVEQGRALERLFSRIADPITLAVDGPWGSGKTVFLRMWASHMRAAGYPVVYYDAFKDDCTQDAFLALAAEVAILAREKVGPKSRDLSAYLTAAKRMGGTLAKRGAGLALRLGTAGVLNAADLEGFAKDAAEMVADEAERAFEKMLESYFEQQDNRRQFAESLSRLAGQIGMPESSNLHPLIFIVDELDRCRTNFALDLLENVKHFFSVSNVHFVLGAHIEQLEHSISAAYGTGIDSKAYLQKFIHVRFRLPFASSVGKNDRRSYVLRLAKLHEVQNGKLQQEAERLFEEIARISDVKALTFRQIERVCTYAVLVLASVKENQFNIPEITAGLLVLRVVAEDKFQKAKEGRLRYDDVRVELGFHAPMEPDIRENYANLWMYVCGDSMDPEVEREYKGIVGRYHFRNREDAGAYLANSIADAFMISSPS